MNTKQILALAAAFTLTLGSNAFAEEIYKWTDEDGNVHYGDRPSGDPGEEVLQMSYNRTSQRSVSNRVQSYRDSAAARSKAREDAAAAEASAAEERALAEENLKKCQDTRAKLKSMVEARRVYREDENGERVYLDDEQRNAARQRAEEMIDEYCG